MSSDLFVFENTFFSDPFSAFTDPHPFEILQENQGNSIIIQESNSNPFLSPSSPRAGLENLTLETTECSVKTEQCHMSFDGFTGFENCFSPQSFDETAVKFMQRSYSDNGFENNNIFSFRPCFDCVLECQDLGSQIMSSPESGGFCGGQMRRVCSTGDLQKSKTNEQTGNVLSSSPLSTDKSFMEETNFKVGRYSAEERKERIDRYRAKRTQRNFNKTIKYACRKTLADNRPRIRGRFARNDEAGDIIRKASMLHRYEDEDDHWMDGFHEEDENGIARSGMLFNISGSTQYHNYSY